MYPSYAPFSAIANKTVADCVTNSKLLLLLFAHLLPLSWYAYIYHDRRDIQDEFLRADLEAVYQYSLEFYYAMVLKPDLHAILQPLAADVLLCDQIVADLTILLTVILQEQLQTVNYERRRILYRREFLALSLRQPERQLCPYFIPDYLLDFFTVANASFSRNSHENFDKYLNPAQHGALQYAIAKRCSQIKQEQGSAPKEVNFQNYAEIFAKHERKNRGRLDRLGYIFKHSTKSAKITMEFNILLMPTINKMYASLDESELSSIFPQIPLPHLLRIIDEMRLVNIPKYLQELNVKSNIIKIITPPGATIRYFIAALHLFMQSCTKSWAHDRLTVQSEFPPLPCLPTTIEHLFIERSHKLFLPELAQLLLLPTLIIVMLKRYYLMRLSHAKSERDKNFKRRMAIFINRDIKALLSIILTRKFNGHITAPTTHGITENFIQQLMADFWLDESESDALLWAVSCSHTLNPARHQQFLGLLLAETGYICFYLSNAIDHDLRPRKFIRTALMDIFEKNLSNPSMTRFPIFCHSDNVAKLHNKGLIEQLAELNLQEIFPEFGLDSDENLKATCESLAASPDLNLPPLFMPIINPLVWDYFYTILQQVVHSINLKIFAAREGEPAAGLDGYFSDDEQALSVKEKVIVRKRLMSQTDTMLENLFTGMELLRPQPIPPISRLSISNQHLEMDLSILRGERERSVAKAVSDVQNVYAQWLLEHAEPLPAVAAAALVVPVAPVVLQWRIRYQGNDLTVFYDGSHSQGVYSIKHHNLNKYFYVPDLSHRVWRNVPIRLHGELLDIFAHERIKTGKRGVGLYFIAGQDANYPNAVFKFKNFSKGLGNIRIYFNEAELLGDPVAVNKDKLYVLDTIDTHAH